MIRNIKAQVNIIIRQSGAKTCFLIMMLLIIFNYINNLINLQGIDVGQVPNFLEISVLSENNAKGWYILTFLSFFVTLPGALSLAKEKKTKINIHLVNRCGGRLKYYVGKIFAVMIVTFLCFLIPFIIELALNLCAFPIHNTKEFVDVYIEYSKTTSGFMYDIFQRQPVFYAITRIIYTSVMASLLSLVPLGFSCVYSKYYACLILPLYFILEFYKGSAFKVFGYYPNHNYMGYFWWGLLKNNRKDFIYFTGMVAVLAVISIAIIIINAIRGEIENENV